MILLLVSAAVFHGAVSLDVAWRGIRKKIAHVPAALKGIFDDWFWYGYLIHAGISKEQWNLPDHRVS